LSTALAWGLVNCVVPAADLEAEVRRFTDSILARSAVTGETMGLQHGARGCCRRDRCVPGEAPRRVALAVASAHVVGAALQGGSFPRSGL
jgi:enoyl-CoA hydratase/carnithine racemase